MGIYTDAVQRLYVAYFNRPADPLGLAYWEGVVTTNKGSTTAVAAAFAASAEYKATYAGLDNAHIVANVYQNLFSHQPDPAGLAYWVNLLNTRALTVDNVVTGIAAGAQGTDLTAYNSKVTAAGAFTTAVDTSAEILGYAGDAANAVARTYLSNVTDATSLAAAIDTTALNATVANVVIAGNPPKVYNLTAGLDQLVGTVGADVFNAYNFNATTGVLSNNLSTFDSVDGGSGIDTLNLDLTGGYNTVTGNIKNVEIINITGNTGTVDSSVFVGATNVNVLGGSASVSNLAAGVTAGFNAPAGNIVVAATGASAAVSMTAVPEAASITVSGATLAAVTVSGARADTDANGSLTTQTLNITAGKDVQTVTVTTNQATTVLMTEAGTSTKHIATVDGSASTGRLFITGNANLATVMTGSAADSVTLTTATAAATDTTAAKNASVSTGAGNDVIVVSTTGTGLTSVDAGAGNDTITVNKITGAGVSILAGDGDDTVIINSAGGVLSTTDIVNGGAGTDVISLAGSSTARTADDYIVFNKLLTNFETIRFSTAESGLDASLLAANYTTIDLAAGSAIVGVGAQSILASGNATLTSAGYTAAAGAVGTTYGGALNVTESRTGTIGAYADSLKLTVKAGTSTGDSTATLTGDTHSATVTLTNALNTTSATTATFDTIAKLVVNAGTGASADSMLSSLTLTGNGSATVTNADGAKLVSVDASALGGTLTLGTNAGAATVGLTYTSTNSAVETIKLGSGVDVITIGNSHYGSMDTVTGLKMTANTATTDVTAGSDRISVTGVTGTIAKFTTTQTDMDLALKEAAASSKGDNLVFQLNGDTYVYHDNVSAAGVANTIDAGDILVKLTGAIDLDTLILSLNHVTPA